MEGCSKMLIDFDILVSVKLFLYIPFFRSTRIGSRCAALRLRSESLTFTRLKIFSASPHRHRFHTQAASKAASPPACVVTGDGSRSNNTNTTDCQCTSSFDVSYTFNDLFGLLSTTSHRFHSPFSTRCIGYNNIEWQ